MLQKYSGQIVGGVVATMAILLCAFQSPDQGFESVSRHQLDIAVGGACYKCRSEDYCKQAKSCNPLGGGLWYEIVGTGITQKFCENMEDENSTATGAGRRTCTADTFKDCVKIKTCTGMTNGNCTNCGDASTEQKTTICNMGGANCNVAAPATGVDIKDGMPR